jgi:hypothetical protein
MVVAATGLALSNTAANAAAKRHPVRYSCKVPVVGTQTVSAKVTLTAPAKATAGKTVKVSVQIQATGLPAVVVTNLTAKSTLTEFGAQKGSVAVTEHLAKANSGSLKLNLTGRLALTKAGTVHLAAGPTATFSLTSNLIGKVTLTCKATSSLPVLGSIAVSKAKAHGRLPAKASRPD